MSDLTTIIKSETERALNVGKNIGRIQEQERNIKLLENPIYHHTFFGPRDVNDEPVILHDGECLGCLAISEIKGEQK